ncbi:helix-turn-helix domain-containing protein [uncultured Oscillibacter sp.]|uniref:helix-turn-helix domain-containing protein n=1 Tax=uncultured Oscillibacter sp. TaxID=876091 RepID=UPI0025DB1ADB|nr:helix-turn-helix transcriptional regulator [uncultured Oscillibacter sp.]
MKVFAERLKELRKECRMTSKEMAEYLAVSQRAYLYYESATHYPDVPGLMKLADYFGVTTDYLLGQSNRRT